MEEYLIRMEAYQLQQKDRLKEMHMQAWLNRAVNATDKNGKYAYRKFEDFYKEQPAAQKPMKRVNPDLYRVARIVQERGGSV